MNDVLETVCPACDTAFQFDLGGSWEDFLCPHCATTLELEVDDWVEWGENGELVDDGVDYTVVLPMKKSYQNFPNKCVDLADREGVNQRAIEGLTHNPRIDHD